MADAIARDTKANPYRVAQWSTGNVGGRALRRVIEHPDMELVGVHVHHGHKLGQDAGVLAGLDPIGVTATNRLEDIVALKADCVLYMSHVCDFDEVCALLESGANVVTTRHEFLNPEWLPADVRARVEAACAKGGTSTHCTGSSPGFISEAFPIPLLSIQRRLDGLHISEFADCSSRNSPEMIFETMGFGAAPETSDLSARNHWMRELFGPSLQNLAEGHGLRFDSVEVASSLAISRRETPIAAGVVPAGTVVGSRTRVSGMKDGRALMTFTTTWFVSEDADVPEGETWNFRESGWNVLVEGDCPMNIDITYPVAPENYADMTPGLTAHRPVNSIPYVCAAPPGFCSTLDLPQVVAKLG